MLGFLNLDKPSGWTSHDCVGKLRRLLHQKKVGHGGTLDPLATGVLPIAVGKATRLLSYLPTEKAYRARVRFGLRTTTDDLEGEIITSQETPNLTLSQIEPHLSEFLGVIQQVPPAYSAISVGGKRLYELARQGKSVEVPVRSVEIQQIEVLNWYPGDFAELELAISCGPGTYIRAIARDLGDILGVGATLAGLTRTSSCGFSLEESLTLTQIETQLTQESLLLIPPLVALKHLETITLPAELAQRWRQGQKIPLTTHPDSQLPYCVVTDSEANFLGISDLIVNEDQYGLAPKIVV